MGKVLPSQRLLKQFEERLVFGDMNLSEIVRSGAQMMLQYALKESGHARRAATRPHKTLQNAPETTKEKGRRNGYESHRVPPASGPSAADSRDIDRFSFEDSRCVVSRTEKLDELIARMYVHGMSTRDIEATFADVLSGTGVEVGGESGDAVSVGRFRGVS